MPNRSRHFRAICLWGLGGIAFMQLALGSAIDWALPEVRDPEYAHRESLLRDRLAVNDHGPVVIALGSSRTQNGFDARSAARALDDSALVFNFGIPTSGPYLERIWVDRLLAKDLKPDLLLLEILPVHYNASCPPPDLRGLDGARLSVGELFQMPVSVSSVAGPWRRWLIGRTLPTYRHQAELQARFHPQRTSAGVFTHPDAKLLDAHGWQPRTFQPEQAAVLKSLAHRQYDPCYARFDVSPRQFRLLDETLRRCREQSIRVALLLPPEGSEFRNLSSPEMEHALGNMLADLKNRHGVSVIDARAWMRDDEFFDMHHLQPHGATAFSTRLARDAIEPLLKECSSYARR